MAGLDQLNKNNIPRHVAVIMDGNGRWAKKKGYARIFGHNNAIKAVRDTVEGAAEAGIKFLTLYAFSTENWNRPKEEVNALMELLVKSLSKELKTLIKNNIRLLTIGDTNSLPEKCKQQLNDVIEKTSDCKHMSLVLALSYSSRWEITEAVKKMVSDGINKKINVADVNDDLFSSYLNTSHIPDPELIIRTSGEYRISNFLLWQIAYSELYFTPKLWPDFRREDLFDAVLDYQKRERRFGLTGEQIKEAAQ
jgi:undecaprenyl diphosphate synthase